MEKALTRVSSLKVGSLWISKKAKEELANITDDFQVSFCSCFCFVFVNFVRSFVFCVAVHLPVFFFYFSVEFLFTFRDLRNEATLHCH